MPLLKYTTQIDVEKTVGEIQRMLAQHSARAIMLDYEDGVVSSLSFKIDVDGFPMAFRLPCNWQPVLEAMKNDPKVPPRLCEQTQAVRVAWRIVRHWVEAQMAFIDSRQVKTETVFLAYTIMRDGKTLAEKVSKNPGFLLNKGE